MKCGFSWHWLVLAQFSQRGSLLAHCCSPGALWCCAVWSAATQVPQASASRVHPSFILSILLRVVSASPLLPRTLGVVLLLSQELMGPMAMRWATAWIWAERTRGPRLGSTIIQQQALPSAVLDARESKLAEQAQH